MIGVDPAERSHAMAVLDGREEQLAALGVLNDSAGYRDMPRLARRWPQRTWAIEGAGSGCPGPATANSTMPCTSSP
jgi:hypothetical protein